MVCCLFGGVKIVEAGTVDISGQCVNMSVSAGETIMPSDICFQKGLGSCDDAGGSISAFSGVSCAGADVSLANTILSCGNGAVTTASGKSVRAPGMLICNEKSWGSVPKPKNVPGDFEQSIKNITDWILGFVGMIAVLMIIWGGVLYLTSAGDEDKAKTGKRTVSYAIIGLVVAGIAYAIVNVIITVIL